jgi:signal transduction histidine kinase
MKDAGAGVKERPAGLLWWPRRRSVVLDALLALVSAVECAVQGAVFAGRAGLPVLPVILLAALAGSVLLLRRRWPVTVLLVSIAVLPAQIGLLLVMVGMYTLATTDAPRRLVASLGCMISLGSTVVVYLVMIQHEHEREPLPWGFVLLIAVMFGVLHVVPPVLLGMYVRARRRLVESLRERADGLERELSLLAERAEERAEWARREERTRIARDMHDVVAHRVSLMVVHAAALQAVALKDPEKASKNAALVGDMGRQALTELRTMLGVLRTDERRPDERPDAASRLAEIAASATAAQSGPKLPELAALVKQSRDAGMAVEFSQDGEVRGYAARVERTAYRVVQEALTNVHKHAAGAATRVRLAHREGEVAVLVQNDPPAGGAGAAGGGAALPSGGNGLLGMRERVTALGGGFVSGPTEQGGFRVSAVIPDRDDAGASGGETAPASAPPVPPAARRAGASRAGGAVEAVGPEPAMHAGASSRSPAAPVPEPAARPSQGASRRAPVPSVAAEAETPAGAHSPAAPVPEPVAREAGVLRAAEAGGPEPGAARPSQAGAVEPGAGAPSVSEPAAREAAGSRSHSAGSESAQSMEAQGQDAGGQGAAP